MQPYFVSLLSGWPGEFWNTRGWSTARAGRHGPWWVCWWGLAAGHSIHFISCIDGAYGTIHIEARWFHQWPRSPYTGGWGFTNNFIQSSLASHLKLVVKPSPHRHVTVGNRKALTSGDECSGVPPKVWNAIFTVQIVFWVYNGYYSWASGLWLWEFLDRVWFPRHPNEITWSYPTTISTG